MWHRCETWGAEHQGGQVLRSLLQGRRATQRLRIHGGEDTVEACQCAGLDTLHPKGRWDITFKSGSRWTSAQSASDNEEKARSEGNYFFSRPLQEGFSRHTSMASFRGNSVFLRTLNWIRFKSDYLHEHMFAEAFWLWWTIIKAVD